MAAWNQFVAQVTFLFMNDLFSLIDMFLNCYENTMRFERFQISKIIQITEKSDLFLFDDSRRKPEWITSRFKFRILDTYMISQESIVFIYCKI